MNNCGIVLLGVFGILFYFNTSVVAQNISANSNLPIIESLANGRGDFFVIFLTGNGGYNKLEKTINYDLNRRNISVVAVDARKYFWYEKSPVRIARDLESLIDRFNSRQGEKKIVLIGYSMGAEILPFAFNSLGVNYRRKISDMIMIGPSQKAVFKIRPWDFLFNENKGTDILPELYKIKSRVSYVICDGSENSICRKDLQGITDHDLLGGGHHFGRDYKPLSRLILKRLGLD